MKISIAQWITWIGMFVVASASLISYAHSTFMTVREKESIENRLDRIETNQLKIMIHIGVGKED